MNQLRTADADLFVQEAPGVWVTHSTIWTTASTLIEVGHGQVIVVDPGVTVAQTARIGRWVSQRWEVVSGFSTHPHWDHMLWHPLLGSGPRWATARAARFAAGRADHTAAAANAVAPGHPPQVWSGLTSLPDGAARLPLPPGTRAVAVVEHDGHAPGHAALVVGSAMIAGDMLSDVEVPLIDSESADPVGDYRAALDELEAAVNRHGVDVLIPGHGHAAAGRDTITDRFATDRAYLARLEAATALTAPADHTVDPRLVGYVADWHHEQVAHLRSRRTGRQ